MNGICELISRNGNPFTGFDAMRECLRGFFRNRRLVMDAELVCLDNNGFPQFEDLLFRRGAATLAVFDLLWIDGTDLRNEPLLERKERLRHLLRKCKDVLFVDHIEDGEGLFRFTQQHDLEGIIAKDPHAPYVSGREHSTWFKIRNPHYTQKIGRDDLFAPTDKRGYGWNACDAACEGYD